jgi:geranylgeranyl diphosphate synthase type 3
LFRLAVGLLQACATLHQTTDFSPLVNNLATYFQIRDDFINLADEEYMKSKSFCEDLTEGKYSYPIIHAIQNDINDTRLASILKQRTTDIDVKRYAQGIMREAGSFEYTRNKCVALKEQIIADIGSFGGNGMLTKVIETLHIQLETMNADYGSSQEGASKRERRDLQIDET